MKIRRPISMILAIVIVLSAISITTVAALGVSNGWFTEEWKNKSEEIQENNVVKYEKLDVGDIAGDGTYADEVKSSASDLTKEKQWYEYVIYSKTPIYEFQNGTNKLVFYDPFDYNYGLVMNISDTTGEFGDYYDSEGYSTANEISVSYSKSKSFSWSHAWSVELGFEETINGKGLIVKSGMKFSQKLGYNGSVSGSDNSSASKTVSYNAIYFNSNGTPYRWRIVHYTVYLPLYCESMILVNGKWVVTDSNYCLLATVQGTCREWINNTAYIEDWKTGEPIAVENFWKNYFTPDGLIQAYINKLTPNN